MTIGFSDFKVALRLSLIMATLGLGFPIWTTVEANEDARIADAGPLRLGVPLHDVPSRMMAVGLSSLVKLEKADFGLDIVWLRSDGDQSPGESGQDMDFVLLGSGTDNIPSTKTFSNLLGVMKYSVVAAERSSRPQSGLLLADATLPASVVETMIGLAMQDRVILKSSRINTAKLTPNDALQDLPMPRHPGVERYLKRHDALTSKAIAETPKDKPHSGTRSTKSNDADTNGGLAHETSELERSFTLYFDTGDAQLDRSDFKSVAEACKFAATLPNARFVISGHTDTVGSDVFNQGLSRKRAHAVANAIRNDPRFREALNVVEFGESQLAIATADGVNEPMNRRVEISVVMD